MPGETHYVGWDSDGVKAPFKASSARCDERAPRDAALGDPGIDGDTAVHRSRAAGEGFGDRAPWFEIDPGMTDLVMPAAMSIAANFGAGGLGGL
jgi:hypothetical protein